MRAVIQRVKHASVTVDDRCLGSIGQGVLALIGLAQGDTPAHADKLVHKLLNYRLFGDEHHRMGCSVQDIGGGLLVVSQFTLMANTHNGLRPDFSPAMAPDAARRLFDYLVEHARGCYPQTQTGQFGADMQVSLVNDGPVTFALEVA